MKYLPHLLALSCTFQCMNARGASVLLGTAGDFAVLAGASISNTGSSVISGGHAGTSPGTAITGFPPGLVTAPHVIHAADAVALQAQSDLTTAYNTAAGLPVTRNLTGQDLGGMTLTPGVYFFSTSAQLTGTLTLDFEGNSDAEFVFQIGSTLTTASNSSVFSSFAAGVGCNVFWQIGSSATLGTDTDFKGHILALTSITLNSGASIDGSALARNGSVTLDNNRITNVNCGAVVPESSSAVLFLLGSAMLPARRLSRRKKSSNQ